MNQVQNQVKISIIVPVYNAEMFLEESLKSLVSQTEKEIEIICVNDGSTDKSEQILKNYQDKDKRIRVINQENKGVSQARNTGIENATGNYVMIVDADDWIDKNACQVLLDRIKKEQSDVLLFPYIRETSKGSFEKNIFEEDKIFDKNRVKEKLHRRYIGLIGEELKNPENADALCTVWGKLYRLDIIKKHNLQFVDLDKIGTYEDGLFNLNYFEYVTKAVYLNQHLYHYRRTERESITSGYNPKLSAQWSHLFNIMQEYIKKHKLSNEYEEALSNRIALSILGLGLNIMGSSYSTRKKIKMIRDIISSPRYQNAYQKMEYKYFPIHWKVFYKCAKYKCAAGIYLLLVAINCMRG